MHRIAVCTPSRGLIHSRTVTAVHAALNAVSGRIIECGWIISHDLPIPDCHEALAQRAMSTGADYVWMVEEDMIPPADALNALLDTAGKTGAGIVAIDYPVGEHPTQSCIMEQDHIILWCGMGCTLIHRSVFETLARPWFSTTHNGLLVRHGDGPWEWRRTAIPTTYEYGGQEIYFCSAATAAGFAIRAVPGMSARHARLRSWGKPQSNSGVHEIDVLDRIEVTHGAISR